MADDFSPQTLEEFVAFQAAKWDAQKTWAIYGDGELGGLVTFEGLSDWAGTAHLLLKPDFQGKGLAATAVRQALGEMFALGGGRLVFYVLAGNLAVGSLIVNLGGKREGCLRGQTLQGGKPTDVWVYGLSKAEFEGKRHELLVRQQQNDQQQHHADHDGVGIGAVQPTA